MSARTSRRRRRRRPERGAAVTKGPFRTLVFGGGGTRCFWHGGFMDATRGRIPLAVERISAVSGGVLSAAAFIADRERGLLDRMCAAFDRREDGIGNIDIDGIIKGGEPFPHEELYRRIVFAVLDDDDARKAVAEGPEFLVQLARPGRLGRSAAVAAYITDVAVRSSPHPIYPKMMGARDLQVDARAAARAGRLCELIVAAASAPPVFDRHYWDGELVMDGGVIDNAPCWAESDDPTLLLVTRPYRRIPSYRNRLYAVPSKKPPTFKLDFTDAQGIREAWALGERDGRAFLREHFPENP